MSIFMTKRERYAIAALQGLAGQPLSDLVEDIKATFGDEERMCDGMAKMAFVFADSMIKASK